jgi:hypothetical protein
LIATWQYVALGVIVTVVLAVLQYKTWRTGVGDSVLFPRLEAVLTGALAGEQFVLASKTHTPNSFGHRSWHFARPPTVIDVYWDGRERDIVVEMRETASPNAVRRRITAIGIGMGNPPDRYQHALNGLVEATIAALRSEAQLPPLP